MWKFLKLPLHLIYVYWRYVLPAYLGRHRMPIAKRYRMIRKATQVMFPLLNIDLTITDIAKTKSDASCLIISNHHGMLDPFLMVYLMEKPIRFVSKVEVKQFPIFGKATIAIDAIFIDRKDVRSQVKVLESMKHFMMTRKERWVIYPEGTRNKQYSQPMMPFKAGSFKHAMEAKMTIVPLVAYGFHRPIHPKINLKRYPVQIDFLPDLTPDQYEGKTTQAVAELLQEQYQILSLALIEKDRQLLLK